MTKLIAPKVLQKYIGLVGNAQTQL